MNFGQLSKALYEVNHPYPEIALLRARLDVKQEGYGLTKIPERVLLRYSSITPGEFDAINISAQIEAEVLAEVDSRAIAEEGLNESIQQHHVDSDEVDRDYIAKVKATRRKKFVTTQRNEYYDIEAEYEGILDLVDEVYEKHGTDLDEPDHKRLRNKLVSFMKRES